MAFYLPGVKRLIYLPRTICYIKIIFWWCDLRRKLGKELFESHLVIFCPCLLVSVRPTLPGNNTPMLLDVVISIRNSIFNFTHWSIHWWKPTEFDDVSECEQPKSCSLPTFVLKRFSIARNTAVEMLRGTAQRNIFLVSQSIASKNKKWIKQSR